MNGQVQRDPALEGDGGEPAEHSPLLRLRGIDRAGGREAREGVGLEWPLPEEMDNAAIRARLYPRAQSRSAKFPIDHGKVDTELMRRGMTLTLCWNEYCEEAVASGGEPYQYSAFCQLQRKWAEANAFTMRVGCKRGEKIEVDWAGDAMEYFDPDTGLASKARVLVACLPWSQYTFAEAFPDMGEEPWKPPRARVLVLRRLGADPDPGQPQDGRDQEHRRRADRQRAVPPHGRVLRLRRRPGAPEAPARQGVGRGGRRAGGAPGDSAPARPGLPVARRAERGARRQGRRHKRPPVPEARGQQGERVSRPGEGLAHPAAGAPVQDSRAQVRHRTV